MTRLWQQVKNVYHLFQAHWWRMFYRLPDRGMKIYGVTGTNGKTTTCYLLASILREAYGVEKVGMLSTVGIWMGGAEGINETKMTTIGSRLVHGYLRRMRERDVQHVVLEVTSHALDQHRLAGLKLEGAIILNIEREHLDYHGTMQAYARAKGKIVGYVRAGGVAVINKEFPSSKSKGDLRVILFTAAEAGNISTPLPGDFNKENVLAASLLAKAVGVGQADIERGVEGIKQVPGRVEWIVPQFSVGNLQFSKKMPRVLIDYAVTPGALEGLYKYVRGTLQQARSSGDSRIFAVFGAAGLRDRGKRPLMARAVAKYADEIVLTREDPWTESEEQIFGDLEKGLVEAEIPWCRIVDRREAIRYALERAKPSDVVVVTGKGAERGMGIGRRIVPWSDKEVIKELLGEL